MPNWCENRAYIETTPEEIAAIVAAIQSEGDKNLLNYLRPEPEHGPETEGEMPNWWNWRVNNWGTKWEVQAEIISHSVEGGWINLAFESAWSPPVDAFDYWASQAEDRRFNLRFIERGMMFCGEAGSNGDTFTINIPASVEEVEATIPIEINEEFEISDTVAQWFEEQEQEQAEA
jgi:hypothetical protein